MIMAHRERSAQENAYLVCNLPFRGSSHSTVYVNTRSKEARTRMLKKECIAQQDHVFNEEDFTSDIYDKYVRRPLVLENICLSEFAQWWRIKPYGNKNNNLEYSSESEDEESGYISEQACLLESRTIIIKRNKAAIVKTPFISNIEQPEEYYYSLILLYFPFRDETTLLDGYSSSFECSQARFNLLRPNSATLHGNMLKKQEELQMALERIQLLRSQNGALREEISGDVSDNNEALEEYGEDYMNDEIAEPPIVVCQNSLIERVQILNKEQLSAYNLIRKANRKACC